MKTKIKTQNVKKHFKKGVSGSISIFLCLLMTPILSISLGLVEYARYQEVIELTEELFELAGISQLCDYDSYLHDRFGVLATSQENELNEGADSYLQDNSNVLGKQLTLNNISVEGTNALTNPEILRRQIIDVSELTATTAILVEDLNLDVLLDKLSSITAFSDAMNTMDKLAELTDKINDAVTAIETLKTSVSTLISSIETAKENAGKLAQKLSDLYTTLGEKGIKLPSNASQAEIEAALSQFDESYISELKTIYITAKTVLNNFNSIKTNLNTVTENINSVITAVEQAEATFNNASTSNSMDSNGSIGNQAVKTLEDVLSDMVGLVEDTLVDAKNETISAAQNTVESIKNTIIEDTGLAGLASRYNAIVNGSYFSLPLSDQAKNDITGLLKVVNEMYSTRSGTVLTSYLSSLFKPNLSFNSLYNDVKDIISNATTALVDNVAEKISETLSKLVKTIRNLFNLTVFYDPALNGFVNISGGERSGYQAFLTALGGLLDAAEAFSTSGLNIFKALDAIKDIFVKIGELIGAIMNIAGDMISSIAELANSAVHADVRGLYEKLLISGYAVHNFPSRTDFNPVNGIQGSGLTSFDYAKIPVIDGCQTPGDLVGFSAMSELIEQMASGGGSDTMFAGAELEYVRAGTNSEIANQIFCFFDIYFIRLLLNLPTVFMDGEVNTLAASTTIAAWLVYIIYIVAEPFCDTVLLVNRETVQLVKSDCWLTPTKITEFITKLGDAVLGDEVKNSLNEAFDNANTNSTNNAPKEDDNFSIAPTDFLELDYSTHMLMVLLVFVESNDQLDRISKLMELEAKEYYSKNNLNFSMSKTYTTVNVSADAAFNPFFDLVSDTSSLSTKMELSVSY